MRLFRLLVLTCFSITYLSCQKELDFQDSTTITAGLVKDGSGNCLPSTVNGIYIVDSTLNTTHYIDVQYNATATGAVVITTDTVNGIYFRDSLMVSTLGLNTLRLRGSGKPVTAGVSSLKLKANNVSSCNIKVTVSPAGGGAAAAFTLAGAPGACTSPVISGTYSVGVPLDPSNKITIAVNVTTAGSYSLSIPLTNGMTFTGSGNFTGTGAQTVSLAGAGMPLTAGATSLTIAGAPAGCSFAITVTGSGSGGGGGTSAFAIAGGLGDCSAGTSFLGKLVAGSALTSSDYMNVEVLVGSLGTYTIQTDTVNGVYFRKSGTFSTTGSQTVSLPGFSTPVTAGPFELQVSGGISNCSTYEAFCGNGAVASAGDYFPITPNSWWSYNYLGSTTDTLVKKSDANTTINSLLYRRFYVGKIPVVTPYDSTHFRKSGQDIYEYIKIDSFIGGNMLNPPHADILLLKQDAPAGTYWESQIFTGTNSIGTALKVKYRFQITNVNTTLVVNGKTYNNVTKVVWGAYVNRDNYGGYPQSFAAESYYAKGIGLIRFQSYPGYPNTSWDKEDLRNYVVF